MKKKIETPSMDKYNLSFKTFAAFTLAEILLSLTVIGIVAAIALPSLLGNANERAWETQKKALYTRFSQALPLLPSLNGYGQLEEVKNGDDTEILDTAAETFIRDGLSKVMKITNICDNDHLTDCGLPDKIIPINGGNAITLSNISAMSGLNDKLVQASSGTEQTGITYYQVLDTKAGAFETVNGESILVYYNPNCESDMDENGWEWYFSQNKMCANFIYDLNGKKGPNTVGKDIGFISVLYSTNSNVVAPNFYPDEISGSIAQVDASQECKNMNLDAKLPNKEEIAALFYNKTLLAPKSDAYWSSTTGRNGTAWAVRVSTGGLYPTNTSSTWHVWCIKR